jgi:hypothetical protein
MTQYFVVYNSGDLAVRTSGSCEDGNTAAQAIMTGTAAKRISTYYPPEQLEVQNQSGTIVVIDTNTGQRVDLIPVETQGTVTAQGTAQGIVEIVVMEL